MGPLLVTTRGVHERKKAKPLSSTSPRTDTTWAEAKPALPSTSAARSRRREAERVDMECLRSVGTSAGGDATGVPAARRPKAPRPKRRTAHTSAWIAGAAEASGLAA